MQIRRFATRGSQLGVEQSRMELSLPFPRRAPNRRARRSRASSGTRVGHALDWLRHNRLALRITLCALVAVPLLGCGWLWLRDSSLVSVRHVHITGVHGAQAIEIREALDSAATRMTTMDFKVGALRSAVSSYAIVGGLRVTTHFPHTVNISVTERPPVAALLTAGQRTAVAADGTVLGPALLSNSLPTVHGSVEPPAGARLREPAPLAAVAVLGAAPTALAAFIVRAFNGPEGVTVAMRNGLLVYFGNSMRPHAKWLSLARVLTSPSAGGAWYVDVRLPERPAAGLSSASSSTPTPVEAGASDPTAAALVASLAKAVGGSVGASAGSSTTSGSGESKTSPGPSEASEAGRGESSSTSPGGTTSSQSGGTTEAPATSTSVPSSPRARGG